MRHVIFPLPQDVTADDSIYGVRIRGDENPDGTWQPCIEFESRRIRLETAPKLTLRTIDALKDWAARLDERSLLKALTTASKGPIRSVRA